MIRGWNIERTVHPRRKNYLPRFAVDNEKHVHHGFLAPRAYLCSTSLNTIRKWKLSIIEEKKCFMLRSHVFLHVILRVFYMTTHNLLHYWECRKSIHDCQNMGNVGVGQCFPLNHSQYTLKNLKTFRISFYIEWKSEPIWLGIEY